MNNKSLALCAFLTLAMGIAACDNAENDNPADSTAEASDKQVNDSGLVKNAEQSDKKVTQEVTDSEKDLANEDASSAEDTSASEVDSTKASNNPKQTTQRVSENTTEQEEVIVKPVQPQKDADVLNMEQISVLLREKFPSANIQHVAHAEIDGLYSFVLQGDLYYIAKNGKYLIKGQMLDISTSKIRNLSSERMAEIQKKESPMRMEEINNLDESDMVVFKAPNEKHVITIFTDVDCGFCQKMHRERQNYLDLGITLRYLAFPRAGLDSKSAAKLEGIWCAADQQTAMTEAKVFNQYRTGNCQTPFKEHMALVRKFGLNGTPGIILENGDLIGGYLPAEVLNRRLEKLDSDQASVANK